MGRKKKNEYENIDDTPKLLDQDRNVLLQALEFLQTPTKGNTIINLRQITNLTIMNMIGQTHKIREFNDFVENWPVYKVSEKGIGREQIIKISEAVRIEEYKKHLNDPNNPPGKI
jgi:hypothetical protein